MQTASPTAALAGVPAGVQAMGPWTGRRQLFVRFAAEAETATMYTPDALSNELDRVAARSAYHSISVSGRDPLANAAFLAAVFGSRAAPLPLMLDCDGQRPEVLDGLLPHLALFQVTLEGSPADAFVERGVNCLRMAAAAGVEHALVLSPEEKTTDGQLLRVISQAHLASGRVVIVVHPPDGTAEKDRRWLTFMEQAAALHADTRILLRLPRPTGMR